MKTISTKSIIFSKLPGTATTSKMLEVFEDPFAIRVCSPSLRHENRIKGELEKK